MLFIYSGVINKCNLFQNAEKENGNFMILPPQLTITEAKDSCNFTNLHSVCYCFVIKYIEKFF